MTSGCVGCISALHILAVLSGYFSASIGAVRGAVRSNKHIVRYQIVPVGCGNYVKHLLPTNDNDFCWLQWRIAQDVRVLPQCRYSKSTGHWSPICKATQANFRTRKEDEEDCTSRRVMSAALSRCTTLAFSSELRGFSLSCVRTGTLHISSAASNTSVLSFLFARREHKIQKCYIHKVSGTLCKLQFWISLTELASWPVR